MAFELFVAVDWSGAESKRTGKDSVWIAHALAGEDIATLNPDTREKAMAFIRERLVASVQEGKRALVMCDFAYGYPAGVSDLLGLEGAMPPWRKIWQHIRRLVDDAGGDENNCCDRWAVANSLNAAARNAGAPLCAPWWGRPDWTTMNVTLNRLPREVRNSAPFAQGGREKRGAERRDICRQRGIGPPNHPHLGMTSPGFPVVAGNRNIREFRHAERGQGAQSSFKICGNGSVGSQVLTGLPYLERLRSDPELVRSKVWPFETGFRDVSCESNDTLVVHAEIFPSTVSQDAARMPEAVRNAVNDCKQVWTVVDHARRLQEVGRLGPYFGVPAWAEGVPTLQDELKSSEGSILFAGRYLAAD